MIIKVGRGIVSAVKLPGCGSVIATNPKRECQKVVLMNLIIFSNSGYALMGGLLQVEESGVILCWNINRVGFMMVINLSFEGINRFDR